MTTYNHHQNLSDRVLEFFKSSDGRKLTNKAVSACFGVPAAEMRALLNELVASGKLLFDYNASGHGRSYFLPTNEHLLEKRTQVADSSARQYKMGREWDRVFERLADYRAIKSKFE